MEKVRILIIYIISSKVYKLNWNDMKMIQEANGSELSNFFGHMKNR
jgi:hypothetical protein